MLESSLVDSIKDALKKRGCVVIKIHGTQYARKGEPDLVGCSYPGGRSFAIEAKVHPNKPTVIQERRLREWAKAGASVGVAYSVQDAIDIAEGRSQEKYHENQA
jgi:hypothetical protein